MLYGAHDATGYCDYEIVIIQVAREDDNPIPSKRPESFRWLNFMYNSRRAVSVLRGVRVYLHNWDVTLHAF